MGNGFKGGASRRKAACPPCGWCLGDALSWTAIHVTFLLLLRLSRQVVGRVPASSDQCVTFHQAFDSIQLQKCHSRAAYVG